jgi:ABC-type transport system involved in multi-copper enzyme maturation permease subunit
MIEMIRRFLRQKFDNPIVAVALAVMALLIAFPGAFTGQPSPNSGFLALLLLAAGSVSKDAGSGALQMILARPISRTDYLWGRFLGILSAYAVFLAAVALLTFLISVALLPVLHVAHAPLQWAGLARTFAAAFLDGVLVAAVLLFFSTFLPGWGDVLGYFLLTLFLSAVPSIGAGLQKEWLTRLGLALKQNVLPAPNFGALLSGEGRVSETVGQWALAVMVFLLAAVLVFRRREFAYGHD